MSRMFSVFTSATLLLAVQLPLCSQDISSNVSAQVISAKPGMVNYVEGRPLVFRGDQEEGTRLIARNQLRSGERVQTGEGDRAEILLSPGSYLRVPGNSQVEITKAEFDDMQFNLIQGIAILESAAFDKKVHALKISTPNGDVKVLEKGLYRFQVMQGGQVEVFVYSGKAEWLKNQHELATLNSKKRYLLGTDEKGKPQFVKLNKDDMDQVDQWSKRRAEYLVAANGRLSDWMFDSGYSNYGYGYRYGGWVFNPFFSAFTFVPFGDYGYSSPYGFYYGSYYPYYGYGYGHGGGRSGGSSSGGGTAPATGNKPANSTAVQRSSTSRSPSAPSSSMSSGRAEQGNRGSVGSARGSSGRQK
jgi:hypothetical protein